jgi:ribosomal RNA-processing protein 9
MGIQIFVAGLCRSHNTMPDPFFSVSKPRKRKRSTSEYDRNPGSAGTSKVARKDGKPGSNRNASKVTGIPKKRGKKADEDLDSDQTNDEGGGIDDLDLRHGLDSGQDYSGDEDENETPAEKRLRLAQLYLNSVKEGLGISYCSK